MPRVDTRERRRALLRNAKALVRRRYRDPDLALTDVASELGSSPRQLQRVFREEGGAEFRAYLLRVRMDRARSLLSRTRDSLPVHAVARQVGYRQASGLRQAFKRYFGVNPSAVQSEPPHYLGTHTWDSKGRLTVATQKTPTRPPG